MWSAMASLYKVLLSSYKLCNVTHLLPINVWPQFAMQISTGVRPAKFVYFSVRRAGPLFSAAT